MDTRALGTSGLQITPLILGGNVFGWTIDEAASFRLLDAFLDAGLNAIDTADVYMAYHPGNVGGESETILGKWMKQGSGRRDRVVLITKVGLLPSRAGLAASNIAAAVEDSLRRLQTDRIDLYFAHIDDDKTPLEETLTAFDGLVRAGKVRAIGASNYSAARLKDAARISRSKALTPYSVLQPRYNLYDRKAFEADLLPVCQEEHLAVTPYFPLAAGFLTAKYRNLEDAGTSARKATLTPYFTPRGDRILSALRTVAERHAVKPAQIALAWVMGQPGITAPIASATSVEQLRDLAGALKVSLSASDRAELETASRED